MFGVLSSKLYTVFTLNLSHLSTFIRKCRKKSFTWIDRATQQLLCPCFCIGVMEKGGFHVISYSIAKCECSSFHISWRNGIEFSQNISRRVTYCILSTFAICSCVMKKGGFMFYFIFLLLTQLLPHFCTELNRIFTECFSSCDLLHIVNIYNLWLRHEKRGLHVLFHSIYC